MKAEKEQDSCKCGIKKHSTVHISCQPNLDISRLCRMLHPDDKEHLTVLKKCGTLRQQLPALYTITIIHNQHQSEC